MYTIFKSFKKCVSHFHFCCCLKLHYVQSSKTHLLIHTERARHYNIFFATSGLLFFLFHSQTFSFIYQLTSRIEKSVEGKNFIKFVEHLGKQKIQTVKLSARARGDNLIKKPTLPISLRSVSTAIQFVYVCRTSVSH